MSRKRTSPVPSRGPDGKQNPEYHSYWYRHNRESVLRRSRVYRVLYGKGKSTRKTPVELRMIAISLLRQRDGDNCWICGLPVNENEASVDHVIDVSKGGTHTADNVQLSHLSCNLRKSKK